MKPSTYIPMILLVYLGIMAWIGRYELLAGRYLYYFGLITLTLIVIYALRVFLLRRERSRKNSTSNHKPQKNH